MRVYVLKTKVGVKTKNNYKKGVNNMLWKDKYELGVPHRYQQELFRRVESFMQVL